MTKTPLQRKLVNYLQQQKASELVHKLLAHVEAYKISDMQLDKVRKLILDGDEK